MPILKISHHGEGLCRNCQEAVNTTYDNGEVETWCQAVYNRPRRITRPVARCSDYIEANKTSRHEMEKIAWTLQTDKKGHAIGFAPPIIKNDD